MPRCIGESERSSSQAPSAVSKRPGGAQTASQFGDDPDVVLRVPGRIEGLAHTLDTPLAVGDRALGLERRHRSRKHHVRHLRGPGHEDVLDDQDVARLQEALGAVHVGFGRSGVLADHVESAEVAMLHRLEHLGEVLAVLRDDGHAPGRLETRAGGRVLLDVLKAGELVGNGAHVAAALDIVLAAKRIETAAVAADVTGQQTQVDEGQDVVDGVVVLGDSEGPAQDRPIGARIHVREFANGGRGNSRHHLASLQRPLHHAGRCIRRNRRSRSR